MPYLRVLAAAVLVLVGVSGSAAPQTEVDTDPPVQPRAVVVEPQLVVEDSDPPQEVDPYEGWGNWCEPFDYERVCQTADDCRGIAHPARRDLRCVHPWYAKENPDYRVCAPGYAGKLERIWRFNRLREIVRQQYFDETKHCKLDGRPLHEEHWRCQQAAIQGDRLARFLWIGYRRETTGRPWKRHRLESDVRAAKTTWYEQAVEYGWSVAVDKAGEVASIKPATEHPNPHYTERHRWHFGLGPIGQNAALWVDDWDRQAPPEVLCRAVPAFEAYLRKARETLKVLRAGIRCSGQRYRETRPTWATIHRALNLGSICPPSTDRHRAGLERFRTAAAAQDIDPDREIGIPDLGAPIPVDGQNDRAAEIEEAVERHWPSMHLSERLP